MSGRVSEAGVWPTLAYRDPDAGIAWLEAVGFKMHEVFRADDDPTTVVHAEAVWPEGGGIMLGSATDNPEWPTQPGNGSCYMFTDDPDGVFARATAAGATVLRAPADQHYGSRVGAVKDPEGNLWSFGNYRPS